MCKKKRVQTILHAILPNQTAQEVKIRIDIRQKSRGINIGRKH